MISKTHTKYIQSLQHKKFRDEHGVFIAEGPKLVPELLDSGKFLCREIFAEQEWMDENTSFIQQYPSVRVEAVKDFELQKISSLASANKVLAVFEQAWKDDDINISGKITLALDTIQDPGNMGTIIRIADWFGVANIICSHGSADIYNPKVVQSTMGSLARVNIVHTDLPGWLTNNAHVKIYAAALEGTPVRSLPAIKEAIIVIGNEAHGIGEEVLGFVNEKITIPRKGGAESLNAAIATAIILAQIT